MAAELSIEECIAAREAFSDLMDAATGHTGNMRYRISAFGVLLRASYAEARAQRARLRAYDLLYEPARGMYPAAADTPD